VVVRYFPGRVVTDTNEHDRGMATMFAGEEDIVGEEDKNQGPFCIYAQPSKGYGPKWHNLTSLRCWISTL
jgi:hypothetical protein